MSAALGVMARAPVPGKCKTRLAQAIGDARAAELCRYMLLDTLDHYAALPCTRHVLFAAPEHDGPAHLRALAAGPWEVTPQVGADLGARLMNAATQLGPGPLILVGSDSPTAPIAAIAEAMAFLSANKRALLGPSDDGGYYLIGLSAPNARVFEDMPWSTNAVLERTQQRFTELGMTLQELPTCFDVDEPSDLAQLHRVLQQDPNAAPHTARALGLL